MNLMNDPIPNRSDFELNTKKAGGVAGKVDGNLTINNYHLPGNLSITTNAVITLNANPLDYTPEEWIELQDAIRKVFLTIKPGSSLNIVGIEPGSIKVFLNGSPEDIAEIYRLIKSKELTKIEGRDISGIRETTPEEDAKIALIQEIKTGEINLRDINLSGVDLSGINLRGMGTSRFYHPDSTHKPGSPIEQDPSALRSPLLREGTGMRADYLNLDAPHEARLFGPKHFSLSGVRLSQTNLFMADLFRADLSGADLRGSDLRKAYLREADLSRADLRGSDLRGADLSGTNLNMAGLVGANLRGANLREADLSGADLRKANLREANLFMADLIEANLRQADLRQANLDGANLRKADLNKAYLVGDNLRGAIVFKTYFGNNEGMEEYQKEILLQQGAIFEKGGIFIRNEIRDEVYRFQMFLDNAMINRTKTMLMSTASIIVAFVSLTVFVVLWIIRL